MTNNHRFSESCRFGISLIALLSLQLFGPSLANAINEDSNAASELHWRGKYVEAESAYAKLLKEHAALKPTNEGINIHAKLVQEFIVQKKWALAEQSCKEQIELTRKSHKADLELKELCLLAKVEIEQKKLEEAKKNLRDAAELADKAALTLKQKSWLDSGMALQSAQQDTNAVNTEELTLQALANQDGSEGLVRRVDLIRLLGSTYGILKRDEESQNVFKKSIADARKDGKSKFDLATLLSSYGWLLAGQEHFKEAEDCFDEASTIVQPYGPDCPIAKYVQDGRDLMSQLKDEETGK